MGLNPSIIRFLLLLGLVLSLPAQASVYKWTDHQGVTHYSQTPPANHSYTRVNVNGTNVPPAAANTQPAKPSRTTQTGQGKHKTKPAKQQPVSDLKHRCQIARKDVTTLHSARRVRIVKKNGQVEWLNQAQRNRRLKKLRVFIKKYCE